MAECASRSRNSAPRDSRTRAASPSIVKRETRVLARCSMDWGLGRNTRPCSSAMPASHLIVAARLVLAFERGFHGVVVGAGVLSRQPGRAPIRDLTTGGRVGMMRRVQESLIVNECVY